MPAKGTKHAPEALGPNGSIARGTKYALARRRERERVRPRDLDRLRRSGTVAEPLRPLLKIAEEEAAELMAALGGSDAVSPQKRILIEDLAAVGMALRGTLAVWLQTQDGESASRIATLAGARRASLAALGLERAARDVPDLQSYLAQRAAEKHDMSAQDGSGNAIDESYDPEAEPAKTCVTERSDGRAGEAESCA